MKAKIKHNNMKAKIKYINNDPSLGIDYDYDDVRKLCNYINNDPSLGIEYDYDAVRDLYKSLGCPRQYYNPCTAPIGKAAWLVEISTRATGKTTNWLLWGLCMYWLYGTVTQYVRKQRDMIAPKNASGMFDVIIREGYIEKITGGEFNNILYKAKKWYLAYTDEEGNIVKKDLRHCIYMMSLDDADQLKSSYNAPTGDIILYDEFIAANDENRIRQKADEFVRFCDLAKTIFRDRVSGRLILCANTIDKENQYFHELEIYDRLSEMQQGDNCLHTTDKGTQIYIEIVGQPQVLKATKRLFNKFFLGFKNPRLGSITGETTWAVRNVQHIPELEYNENLEVLTHFYVYHNLKYIRLDLVKHSTLGVCVYCHWATRCYPDSIIFSVEDQTDPRYIYGFNNDYKVVKLLMKLMKRHRFYFASNDVGSFLDTYLVASGLARGLIN